MNRLLRDHAIELRRSPAVKNAEVHFEALSCINGPVLEGTVDVWLADGNAFCWCLDVRWNSDS
jgi:hypothetical protein